jgi:NAD(P)-dependent dehydrogenase (short-subunit alcohol dehydrogenase family)
MGQLLEGKKILVTGGSRGLGRAFCARFAEEGANVAFTYSSDAEGAAKTSALIEKAGRKAVARKVSVLDAAGLAGLVKELESAWGSIDVLVNNAGVSQPLPVPLMEESDWDQLMDTNVKGCFLAAKSVLPGMIRRRKGLILNIGSLAGERMIAAPVHYSASKAALRGFTEALTKEVDRYKIRVLCLAPGLLEEGVAQNLPDYKLDDYLKNVSLHRRGTLEEVARCAAFLISDRNSYMNGETVVMDGGF